MYISYRKICSCLRPENQTSICSFFAHTQDPVGWGGGVVGMFTFTCTCARTHTHTQTRTCALDATLHMFSASSHTVLMLCYIHLLYACTHTCCSATHVSVRLHTFLMLSAKTVSKLTWRKSLFGAVAKRKPQKRYSKRTMSSLCGPLVHSPI